ncbi:hypothetical protein JHK86_004526 [Glycine max]|nr:hypothetical protein JHK86_004526 [Glycine max]
MKRMMKVKLRTLVEIYDSEFKPEIIISKKGKHTYDTKCYHGEGNNRVANTTIEWYGGVHNSEGSRNIKIDCAPS